MTREKERDTKRKENSRPKGHLVSLYPRKENSVKADTKKPTLKGEIQNDTRGSGPHLRLGPVLVSENVSDVLFSWRRQKVCEDSTNRSTKILGQKGHLGGLTVNKVDNNIELKNKIVRHSSSLYQSRSD